MDFVHGCATGPGPNKLPHRKGNPLNHLSVEASQAIEAAHESMRATFCGRISTLHLLLGLLNAESGAASALLRDVGLDSDTLRRQTRVEIVSDGQIATPQKKFSRAAKRALERAQRESKEADDIRIRPDHLLIGLLPHSEQTLFGFKAAEDDFIGKVFTASQAQELREAYEYKLDGQWDEHSAGSNNGDDPLAHLSKKADRRLRRHLVYPLPFTPIQLDFSPSI